jgi:Na+/H+ antiporter NhaB
LVFWLIVALAFHLAEVGHWPVGDHLATTFSGVTDEHAIGKAFTEALPFTAADGVLCHCGGDHRPAAVHAGD